MYLVVLKLCMQHYLR